MSYGTCESAKAIELDRDKRLNEGGGGGGKGGEGRVKETNHEAKRVWTIPTAQPHKGL